MRWRRLVSLGTVPMVVAALLAGASVANAAVAYNVNVWTESSYTSVFKDSGRSGDAGRTITLDAAKNDYESGQVVLRMDQPFTVSAVTFSALSSGANTITADNLSYNFVGYEYLNHPSTFSGQEVFPLVRKAPGDFPDRLLNQRQITVPANTTQSVWIRVYVPPTAAVGLYSGAVTVTTDQGAFSVPITANVRDVTIPPSKDSDFSNTLWQLFTGNISYDDGAGDTIPLTYKYAKYSDKWWQLIDNVATTMREYRSNVLAVPVVRLLADGGSSVDASGNYTFNWSRFDQVIQRFLAKGGVKRLEGQWMSGRHGDSAPWYTEALGRDSSGATVRTFPTTDSPEATAFIKQYVAALQAHLQAMGWTSMWQMHISDEPKTADDEREWRSVNGEIRAIWPDVRIGDATFDEPVGSDIAPLESFMIPEELNYSTNPQVYRDQHDNHGKEMWLYNCVIPVGGYLNRFIDQPVWDQRLTMWYAYSQGMTGYLHWAMNNWQLDINTQTAKGDGFIVRPDVDNNTIEVSPRYESLRSGIQDWEVLNILGKKNPQLARKIAASLAPQAFAHYTRDTAYMQRVRALVLDAAAGKPLIANDLARGATASASTESTGAEAGKAVDGDSTTGWSPSSGSGVQWLRLDFGRQIQLDGVRLHWGSVYGTNYKVQLSFDGNQWADAVANTSGSGGDDYLGVNAKARFLRLQVNAGSAGATPYQLDDLQVAGFALRQQNLAGGRPYTVSANRSLAYPDYGNDATDGFLAGPFDDKRSFGYSLPNAGDSVSATVTVDLGYSQPVGSVRTHAYEEYPDYRPDQVVVSTSNDNVAFTQQGTLAAVNGESTLWYDISFPTTTARWVRLTFAKTHPAGNTTATGMFLDEIEAYGGGSDGSTDAPVSSAYEWTDPSVSPPNHQEVVFTPSSTGALHRWNWTSSNGTVNDDWGGGPIAGKTTGFPWMNQQHVFARSKNNTLLHWWLVAGETTRHYADWSGEAFSDPTAVVWGGQQHIFAKAADGSLFHWWWDPADSTLRTEKWPAPAAGITGNPAAYAAGNQLHVVARGSDNHLYNWAVTANQPGVTGPLDWGGQTYSDPTAFTWNGQQHVFARAADGNLFHWYFDSGDSQVHTDRWTGAPAAFVGNPMAYKFGNQQHVVARGPQNTLYHWWWDQGTGTISFADWGGEVYSDPLAYVWENQQQIVSQSMNHTLHHYWWMPDPDPTQQFHQDDWGGDVSFPAPPQSSASARH
ncbi:glycoside hydrolase domain-containing protein [Fodinicola acaciae]|uniref:glycoside hydrolase domain-containing protein n=1 Tax=Fodinicola acaciae TaxID=2681555 RepID=UPI0013D0487F|nr:glycoside hydrolase domain-containing protein [Fodinicola acaciae]